MLLALDTSTPLVSVALYDDGIVDTATSERPMQHGEQLAPMITAALERVGAIRQDVTAVAAGVGPGPYTGLRVGLVTARTLGLALGIPVYGVCSLDVLGVEAADTAGEPVVATIDARRKELFWAEYDEQGQRLGELHVERPAAIAERLDPGRLVVGAGPQLYPEAFARTGAPERPSAATLALVVAEERAELVDPEPVYLRRPDAVAPGPPKKVS
ncbi:tRNA (adenosine(37)-N6)-threonylcarbamoyltransferase complex dimerization subunit type 1 TsaB [Nocardioides caldifontis]|uniref:tRNA (adenosine(37)-N6)-threonylcarbamoyltransferase complex dimerization subunit type 1 TsaB n=1 Tax=Nocardioides caldifontis TaxID=2588938 RepID=UPI0011DFB58E|nr:tRNA (adenosine(37)-N6)-threonylcarbamoyltransferase complex dimerization subunit type 1 TsaB [Nocardioides caldifontis]